MTSTWGDTNYYSEEEVGGEELKLRHKILVYMKFYEKMTGQMRRAELRTLESAKKKFHTQCNAMMLLSSFS